MSNTDFEMMRGTGQKLDYLVLCETDGFRMGLKPLLGRDAKMGLGLIGARLRSQHKSDKQPPTKGWDGFWNLPFMKQSDAYASVPVICPVKADSAVDAMIEIRRHGLAGIVASKVYGALSGHSMFHPRDTVEAWLLQRWSEELGFAGQFQESEDEPDKIIDLEAVLKKPKEG